MVSLFYNKDPLATVNHMESYFKQIPPDCSLFSEDGFEIPVHKEILYQTEFMRQMLKSVDMDYCKIDILCQTVSKQELFVIVKFLYNGEICCSNYDVASHVSKNLNELFGFPAKNFKFNGESLNEDFKDIQCHTVSNCILLSFCKTIKSTCLQP